MRWRSRAVRLLLLAIAPACIRAAWTTPGRCQPCDLGVSQGPNDTLIVQHNPSPMSNAEQQKSPSANFVWARYWDSYEDTGWDRLEISVLEAVPVPDSVKARAAGYVEGQIHAKQIYDYWTNYRLNEFQTPGNKPTQELYNWVHAQDAFIRKHIQLHASSASSGAGAQDGDGEGQYWRLMGLVMDQFDGLCEGFWDSSPAERNMTYHELYLLQSVGDLYDLKVLFPQHLRVQEASASDSDPDSDPPPPARHYTPGHGQVGPGGYGGGELLECSALIKLQGTGDEGGKGLRGAKGPGGAKGHHGPGGLGRKEVVGSTRRQVVGPWAAVSSSRARKPGPGPEPQPHTSFWAGHATWRAYYAMLRTWKIYQLPWSKTGPITVSSSPGLVGYSKDDWYTTNRFVVMETTNGIYNHSLYDAIHHDCALTWQRVQVANHGATSGAEWASLFGKHNSGTYNNQWMVLDVDRLSKGRRLGVLWVLEQIPGATEAADVSEVLLQQGYWASYNVPFFDSVYNSSGYPLDQDVYQSCPRAQLFAREQEQVHSTQDMQALMRLNRYQADPMSHGNPADAIASRYDLEPVPGMVSNWTRRAYGAVDAKVVDTWAFSQQLTYVINGPTDDDQPPFSWSDFCAGCDELVVEEEGGERRGGRGAAGALRPRRRSRCETASAAHAADESTRQGPLRPEEWLGAQGCGISHTGLVDTFEFEWEGIQASLPWMRFASSRVKTDVQGKGGSP